MAKLRRKRNKLKGDLETLAEKIIQMQMQSDTLLRKLNEKEIKLKEMDKQIFELEHVNNVTEVTEEQIKDVFRTIKKKLKNGNLEHIKQVIATYVNRIEVFTDVVVIDFNYFPTLRIPRDYKEYGKTLKKKESPVAVQTNELSHIVSHPKYMDEIGGEGGIRTHVPFPANAFRVRPVMTTSIPLHMLLLRTGDTAFKRKLPV